jgi:DNA-binding NtrC family response regulator
MPIRPTVLIIEDEAVIRELLHEVLHTYGYSVITAATVQEAEEIRQRLTPEAIGLVLTDINLSHTPHGQEGYDLFQRWTEAHPTLPFVLMSAAASSLALPAMRTGRVRLVSKPFDLDALLAVVEGLLRESTVPKHLISRRPPR